MSKLVSAVTAIYVAIGLYSVVPYVKTLTVGGKDASGLFWNHLAIFAILAVAAFIILARHIESYGSGIKAALTALALIGLIVTVLYHIVPIAPVHALPKLIEPYFAGDMAYTAWLIAPLVILFF